MPTPTSNGTQGYFNNGTFPALWTDVTPDWCNALQEEVVQLASLAGQTPAVGSNNQMLLGVLKTFTQSRGTFWTTNGTTPAYNSWVCPANTYLACVEVSGGGGGGGAATAPSSEFPNGTSGGGGGAGGYLKAYVKVVPGYTYSIVSGNGGAGGTISYAPGYAGTSSSFSAPDGTAVLIGYGGGNPNTAFDGGGGGGVVAYGNAVSLVVEAIGGYGGEGSQYNIQYTGGHGAASVFGDGGRAGVLDAPANVSGDTWSAGGGGSFGGTSYGTNYTTGGVGGSGIVIITY